MLDENRKATRNEVAVPARVPSQLLREFVGNLWLPNATPNKAANVSPKRVTAIVRMATGLLRRSTTGKLPANQ